MTEHTPQQADVPGEPFLPPSPVDEVPTRSGVDDALAQRLQHLAAARSQTGRAAIPPTARTTASPTKRRHPAKYSRAAALALSVMASGGLGVLFATGDAGVSASPAQPVGLVTPVPAAAGAPAATPPTPSAATTPSIATSPSTAAPTAAPTTAPATTGPATTTPPASVAPAVVNGNSFSNKYGNVQVQATFAADGTITDVTTLEVPFRDGESVDINRVAVPRLNSAALNAQTANVDTVSGATYTSIGYKKSLQSAIDTAVANGIPAAGA